MKIFFRKEIQKYVISLAYLEFDYQRMKKISKKSRLSSSDTPTKVFKYMNYKHKRKNI